MAQQGHSAFTPILDTTGPSGATSAVFIIYDIFGFSSQALQGADILAHVDESHQYQVFMPDFFLGKPLPLSVFPPDTDEKKKQMGDFFAGPANPPDTAKKVPELVKNLGQKYTGIQKWGSLGMCWGGKIVSLTSQSGTLFSAAAEVHPAMVDPEEAKGVKIPLCMLASGDENPEDVEKFKDNLNVDKRVETFKDQVHGWMAARWVAKLSHDLFLAPLMRCRGDLKNERVKSEYERGYGILLDFYDKHL
ncbi:MAG: hypothetical protein Q9173_004259 [Seirophora scorigena]